MVDKVALGMNDVVIQKPMTDKGTLYGINNVSANLCIDRKLFGI